MARLWLVACALIAVSVPQTVHADNQCHVVDVSFVPSDQLQIVAWVEQPGGTFLPPAGTTCPAGSSAACTCGQCTTCPCSGPADAGSSACPCDASTSYQGFVSTIYITNKVGLYGMGNRPGRFDFNSGPTSHDLWPYGRRMTTFPVWAHRQGQSWPEVDFQDGEDSDLSHAYSQSSPENDPPYCRPMNEATDDTWDAGTCASPGMVFTDKGVFSATATSLYPPRADLTRDDSTDSPSVAMYKMMNPFDAVTQATPPGGSQAQIVWSIPNDLAPGNYVLFVEVSKEYDFNATYNSTVYPPPQISYSYYGVPYRGQPSVVYSVPFTIGTTEMVSSTQSYIGYGDPTGVTNTLNPPDSTITTDTPASGASRLEMLPGSSDVVVVDAKPIVDATAPGPITQLAAANVTSNTADIDFIAPGSDGNVGEVSGYEVRVRANDAMTAENFGGSMLVAATVVPASAGSPQRVQVTGLLPETNYWVGIRAYDECHNEDDLAIVELTTGVPQNGEVDACFVATAAYGSMMANDVELLRHFRDSALRSTAFGELFIESYYTFGPPVAGVVGSSELLRATARAVLDPIVELVRGAKY